MFLHNLKLDGSRGLNIEPSETVEIEEGKQVAGGRQQMNTVSLWKRTVAFSAWLTVNIYIPVVTAVWAHPHEIFVWHWGGMNPGSLSFHNPCLVAGAQRFLLVNLNTYADATKLVSLGSKKLVNPNPNT